MKMKLLFIALIGFVLVGCKSDVEKCVDAGVEFRKSENKNGYTAANEKQWRVQFYHACLKSQSGK